MWDFLSSARAVCVEPDGRARADHPRPAGLLPGSFHPLHHGHTSLAAVAAARLGVPVHFELSVTNADKPELPRDEVARRVAQFAAIAPIWVTRAPTFEAKADLFPARHSCWGGTRPSASSTRDTTARGRATRRRKLLSVGCRLVVGGRLDAAGAFRVWDAGAARVRGPLRRGSPRPTSAPTCRAPRCAGNEKARDGCRGLRGSSRVDHFSTGAGGTGAGGTATGGTGRIPGLIPGWGCGGCGCTSFFGSGSFALGSFNCCRSCQNPNFTSAAERASSLTKA